MSTEHIRAHCPRCRHRQIFKREEIHHRLHFILTILSLGLWGISWLAIIIGARFRPYHCDQCGYSVYQ
ncbi:MAG: hypothetical protein WCP06_05725 [Verrucomicrobiota bacterium]